MKSELLSTVSHEALGSSSFAPAVPARETYTFSTAGTSHGTFTMYVGGKSYPLGRPASFDVYSTQFSYAPDKHDSPWSELRNSTAQLYRRVRLDSRGLARAVHASIRGTVDRVDEDLLRELYSDNHLTSLHP